MTEGSDLRLIYRLASCINRAVEDCAKELAQIKLELEIANALEVQHQEWLGSSIPTPKESPDEPGKT